MRKLSYRAVCLIAACAVVLPPAAAAPASKEQEVSTDGWSGERAMADIATQLRFTPRSLDTPGHQKTIDFIEAELAKTPVKLALEQRFSFRGADGTEHALTNIVARPDPNHPPRVMVATP